MRIALVALGASLLCGVGDARGGEPEPTYSFNGIAALSGCSGSVFRLHGQSLDDRALVLTNGHCIGFLGEFEVLVGVGTDREVTLFDRDDAKTAPMGVTEIVYATMHQTDMAVLRLDATYQELADAGVDALLLATERGTVGEEVAIVSGLWEYVTRCELDGFVHAMQEGAWTWSDSLRFAQECVTFGGTSGSPVISVVSGEIIGVNNTGYEGGEPCTVNNPCEIDENGTITTIPDGSYGQQTYQLYSCVDDAFAIDLDRPGCALPRPAGVLRVAAVELRADQECDGDGILDAGETAVVAVTLRNDGPVALADTTLALASPSPGVELAGTTMQVAPIAEDAELTVELAVALDAELIDIATLELEITAADPSAAEPEVVATAAFRVNFDDLPSSSTVDDVESGSTPWTAVDGWSRELVDAGDTAWRGVDIPEAGDQRLESPALEVGNGALVVRFSHRYRFETSRDTYWDGGVVELSTDDGATWIDAAELADVAYGGTITDESGNPLGNRAAFVGTSPAWPDRSDAILDFGTGLAGERVRLRFRLGTDRAAGDFGWEIDHIAVDGIDNLPFSSVGPDADACGAQPPDDDPPDDDPPAPPGDDDTDGGGCSTTGSRAPWLPLALALALAALRQRARDRR